MYYRIEQNRLVLRNIAKFRSHDAGVERDLHQLSFHRVIGNTGLRRRISSAIGSIAAARRERWRWKGSQNGAPAPA